jgi:type I restriction enzyme S subunit
MLLSHLNLLATAPGGVARLRELILTLAVQGKLVPQHPRDEPASELLKKIRAEKARLIAEGKIKQDKPLAEIADEEKPFGLPIGWEWARWTDIALKIGDIDHKMPSDVSDGVPYVSPRDFYGKNEIDFAGAKKIARSDFLDLASKIRPEKGDLIYPRYGTIGVIRMVMDDREFLASYSCAVIKVLRGCIEPSYQYLFSMSDCVKRQAASATNKTTQPNVGLKSIQEFLVPLPPLAEQSRIVTRVEELMRLCDALEVKGKLEAKQHAQLVSILLATLTESETSEQLTDNWHRVATHFDLLLDRPQAVDSLEQTILQLAVRGLLVPQNPQDEPASALLKKIRVEKDKLIAEGKIKRDKPLPPIGEEEQPFALPQGWEWVRLQQAYDVRDGTHDTPKYQSTGFPLVTSKNIYGGALDLSDVKLISPADHEQISARSKVDRNDILFAMIGSIGNPVLVDTDVEFSVKNVALFKYYAPFLSCPEYLLLVLQTEAAGMKERAAGGVQSFISLGQLRSSIVAIPPLAEQSRIVTRVAQLRRLCADLRQRLSASQSTQAHLAEALVAENP